LNGLDSGKWLPVPACATFDPLGIPPPVLDARPDHHVVIRVGPKPSAAAVSMPAP